MMKFFLLLLLMIPFSIEASLKDLASEAENKSKLINIYKYNIDLANSGYMQTQAGYDWTLRAGLDHTDSYKDSLFSFQALRTITDSLSVSVERPFSWGGALRIDQGLVQYNLTKWGGAGNIFSTGGLSGDEPAEYISRITYTQNLGKDFWGRLRKLDAEIAKTQIELSKKEYSLNRDSILGRLSGLYAQGRYFLALIETTDETIRRYQKKMKVVRKRVEEGLKLKVDLLQMESEYVKQVDIKNQYEIELEKNLNEISIILGRNILASEVKAYTDKLPRFTGENWVIEKNLEVEKAKASLAAIEASLKKSKRLNYPDIQLKASLGTNGIDSSLSDAYEKGNFNSKFQEKTIGLNVVIPLGGKMAKAEIERYQAQKFQQETQIEILNERLAFQFSSIKNKMKLHKKTIDSNIKRVQISKDILAEYERLYSQGRILIDVVLGAQDSLNRSHVDLYNSLLSYDLLGSEIALLTNHISDYIKDYKD